MSSNIIGSLIGGYMMSKSSGPSFFIIMGSIMIVAAIGMSFNKIPKTDKEFEHKTVMEEVVSSVKMVFDKRMLYLDLYILFTGVSISFWSSLLIPAMTFELDGTKGDAALSDD